MRQGVDVAAPGGDVTVTYYLVNPDYDPGELGLVWLRVPGNDEWRVVGRLTSPIDISLAAKPMPPQGTFEEFLIKSTRAIEAQAKRRR